MTQHSSCIVIPFPTLCRVGRIRRVARVLSERSGKGADAYWRRTLGDLRRSMEKARLEPELIERELEDFRQAVAGAMVRQGGAA